MFLKDANLLLLYVIFIYKNYKCLLIRLREYCLCHLYCNFITVIQGQPPIPNPHGDPLCPKPLMIIQHPVAEVLYGRSLYVKKIIEEANAVDETAKLLKVLLVCTLLEMFQKFRKISI